MAHEQVGIGRCSTGAHSCTVNLFLGDSCKGEVIVVKGVVGHGVKEEGCRLFLLIDYIEKREIITGEYYASILGNSRQLSQMGRHKSHAP